MSKPRNNIGYIHVSSVSCNGLFTLVVNNTNWGILSSQPRTFFVPRNTPPTSGLYFRGDKIYRSNVDLNSDIGWLCVTGTEGPNPAVWASLGIAGHPYVGIGTSQGLTLKLENSVDAGEISLTNKAYVSGSATDVPTVAGGGGIVDTSAYNTGSRGQTYLHVGAEDSLWFRRKLSSNPYGSWFQVASRTWVNSQISTSLAGSVNRVSKFTSPGVIGNSLVFDNGTNVGIGTDVPIALLDVGGSAQVNSLIYPRIAGNSDANRIEAVQLQNKSSGELAESRFLAAADDGTYIAVTQPSSNNVATAFFGAIKNTGSFIFNTLRNLYIGTLANKNVFFGTNNVVRMTITNEGKIGIGNAPMEALDVTGKIRASVAPTNATDVVRKTELDLKSNLSSPSFGGIPLAPTAISGTNTSQIATTAYVKAEIDSLIKYGFTDLILDGVETVFNIPHGMGITPTSLALTFSDITSVDLVSSIRTLTSTNIVITCINPPSAGTVKIYWQVFK